MPAEAKAPPVVVSWKGKQWQALTDTTPALDIEGALRASKTTIALWREVNALLAHPGMHTLISRWTEDDTNALLKPVWRAILAQADIVPHWNGDEHYDRLPNGSIAYIRGLKAPEAHRRYSKFRGLTLSRVYVDQAEELPRDVYHELKARLSQKGYPHAITITPQAVEETHWIAKEFPEGNPFPHRRYIPLSVYDNAHNLDEPTILNLEDTYPVGHPKRRTLIFGQRGMNVIGDPVYGGAFNRPLHERPLAFNPALPLEEAIDFGKHHPCWICRQVDPFGAVLLLGGVQGEDMFLDDFLDVIARYRQEWFPDLQTLKTCCDPAGSHQSSQGLRQNGVEVLRAKYPPRHPIRYADNSNAPDVRLGMVEELAAAMRKRTPLGEAFGIDGDEKDALTGVVTRPARWLLVSPRRGVLPWKFLADGCEAGYVWDEHLISVHHKPQRHPKKDGWYEHGQNCMEYLQVNFSTRRKPAPAPAPPPGPPPVQGPGAWMG